MDIDFEFYLTLVVIACVAIWLLDFVLLRPRRTRAVAQYTQGVEKADIAVQAKLEQPSFLVEQSNSLLPVLLFVWLVRSFVAEPFTIPSGSMLPTLEVGDYILVSKYSYGIKLPVLRNTIIETGSPERGDVVVFRYPTDPSISFIKRLVGLPGDTVSYKDGILYVNGEEVAKDFVERRVLPNQSVETLFVEHLGERDHFMRRLRPSAQRTSDLINYEARDARSWQRKLMEGEYFMMGDNRDESSDSRFWGIVPERNIVGEAALIWMHKDPGLVVPSFSRSGWLDSDLPSVRLTD